MCESPFDASLPGDIIFVEIARWASRATRQVLSHTCQRGNTTMTHGLAMACKPKHFWYKWLADKFEREVRGDLDAESQFWTDLCNNPQVYGRLVFDRLSAEVVFSVAAKTGECDALIPHVPETSDQDRDRNRELISERVYYLAYKHGNSRLVSFAMKVCPRVGYQYHHPAVAVSRGHFRMAEEWTTMNRFLKFQPHRNLKKETLAIVRSSPARDWTYVFNSKYLSTHLSKILEHDCASILECLAESNSVCANIAVAALTTHIPKVLKYVAGNYSQESLVNISLTLTNNVHSCLSSDIIRQILPLCQHAGIISTILKHPDHSALIPGMLRQFPLSEILTRAITIPAILNLCEAMKTSEITAENIDAAFARSTRSRCILWVESASDIPELFRVYSSGLHPKFRTMLRWLIIGEFVMGCRIPKSYDWEKLAERCYVDDNAELLSRVVNRYGNYSHTDILISLNYPSIPRITAWRLDRGLN